MRDFSLSYTIRSWLELCDALFNLARLLRIRGEALANGFLVFPRFPDPSIETRNNDPQKLQLGIPVFPLRLRNILKGILQTFKRKLLWQRRDDEIIGDKIARQRRC